MNLRCKAACKLAQERPVLQPMKVVPVDHDGDSLFHALAHFDGYDGKVLRIELANFMEAQAAHHPGFEELWLLEAFQLRSGKWGGSGAIIAYSLMKARRVMVHTAWADTPIPAAEEVSHASIYGQSDRRTVHILCNGNGGYYDALVEIPVGTSMEPTRGSPFALQTEDLQHLDFSSLYAPIAAYSQAYVASWTVTSHRYREGIVTEDENEELLRLAGWILQLICMPPPKAHQFRTALRTWQAMLRQRFGGRALPWPWSFMVYGMLL